MIQGTVSGGNEGSGKAAAHHEGMKGWHLTIA